jgi:hypothetical protein
MSLGLALAAARQGPARCSSDESSKCLARARGSVYSTWLTQCEEEPGLEVG